MTDEELMTAVCKGDQSAYQTIVKQHLRSISHYAFRILGNQKDAEDISQEAFLRLWINTPNWKPKEAKLTTWLHKIAHNLCIDYLRKHGRVETRDYFQDEIGLLESNNNNGDENKKLQLLKQTIGKLPENQRNALTLCHYQGFSNREAAVIMNISVEALRSAIARAKRSLKNQLSRFDEFTDNTKMINDSDQQQEP